MGAWCMGTLHYNNQGDTLKDPFSYTLIISTLKMSIFPNDARTANFNKEYHVKIITKV